MFSISLSSSSVYFFIPEFPCLISSSSSLIVSIVLRSLFLPPFHLQFLSNLAQYSLLYLLSIYPNNFFAVNFPGNSPLQKVPSSFSCLLMSSMSLLYSLSYSSIASLAFFRFPSPFQVSVVRTSSRKKVPHAFQTPKYTME